MQMSKELLFSLSEKVKNKGKIDEELIEFLEELFPNRSEKILEVLNRGITKYTFKPSNRIIWTAIGENDEYYIYPKIYCSCIDFYNRVVVKRKEGMCKHLIAQFISDVMNNFKEKELDDKNFTDFIDELKLEE